METTVMLQAGSALAAVGLAFLAYKKLSGGPACDGQVNKSFQKDQAKVVHCFDMEDMGDKEVYCRCWRSKQFPYCDGAHVEHNKTTGDNVGPLIINKKKK